MVVKNCRFGCNDAGKYFDTITRRMVNCPDCFEERRAEVRNGEITVNGDLVPLHSAIGMAENQRYNYDLNQAVPPKVKSRAISGLNETLDAIQVLHNTLVLGEKPQNSLCFGLPNGSQMLQLGYSFLVDAYKAGISIAPMVASHQYHTFLHKDPERVSDKGVYYSELRKYESLYTADLVVVLITSGGNSSVINTAKGLMQSRAISGLPTVFLTSKPSKDLREIVDGDETFNTARGFFIQAGEGEFNSVDTSEDPAPRSMSMDDLSSIAKAEPGSSDPLEFNTNRTTL